TYGDPRRVSGAAKAAGKNDRDRDARHERGTSAWYSDRTRRGRRTEGIVFGERVSAIERTRCFGVCCTAARPGSIRKGQMNAIDFFSRHGSEIAEATLEHIWLVGATMLLSVAIGIPLGILVARRPWL